MLHSCGKKEISKFGSGWIGNHKVFQNVQKHCGKIIKIILNWITRLHMISGLEKFEENLETKTHLFSTKKPKLFGRSTLS